MFEKLKNQWKEIWWSKESESIKLEYSDKKLELESSLNAEISNLVEIKNGLVQKLKFENEELNYRIKVVIDRQLELKAEDASLKQQIRIIEAKASPASVWTEAFTQGMSKAWDLMLPTMVDNIERLKKKIYEDATFDAISRMNGGKK